jgi:hypothetical protein
LEAVPELTIDVAAPPCLNIFVANTISWFATVNMAVEAVDIFPAASMTKSL